jgi:two-component system, chemotaxis family, protein-glutamate methylesterase/glutaminase
MITHMPGFEPVKPAKTRVLLVDDSAIVRKLLADALRAAPDVEVVGVAPDPIVAFEMIERHKPDVLTLDLEMPKMDGLTFLRKLMSTRPLPVIIVSSATQTGSAATIEALRAGAMDVIAKPGGPQSIVEIADKVVQRVRGLRNSPRVRLLSTPVSVPQPPVSMGRMPKTASLIAVGASTGGPQAIETLLTRLPADCPPIVIVQHLPASFTRAFAERLNTVCPMQVVEAQAGDVLRPGTAYIAPGDRHMEVERDGVRLRVGLRTTPPVHHQRPAVDVLFNSVAALRGGLQVVAVLLTGMGADGADGMVALRKAGAQTLAEDEHSCVVFGMPKEAIARGGATHVVPLWRMPAAVAESFERLARPAA